MLGELVGDRQHRRPHALVVGGQEADQRDQQQRGVERVGLVVLAEDAALADAALEDLGLHRVRLRSPARRRARSRPRLAGEPGGAVERDPAHQLRGDVVLGLAARLPDPLVGLVPGRDRGLDLLEDDRRHVARARPRGSSSGCRSSRAGRRRRRSGAGRRRRCRSAPAATRRSRSRWSSVLSVSSRLAADPVHDLGLGPAAVEEARDELHELARLLVEAEHVQAPEGEGRVADPGVAVVPVALPARRLGQRGGQRGDHRPGRLVGQPLEHQRRALQGPAPGVVGKRPPLAASGARARRCSRAGSTASAASRGPLSSSRQDRHEKHRSPSSSSAHCRARRRRRSRAGCRRAAAAVSPPPLASAASAVPVDDVQLASSVA